MELKMPTPSNGEISSACRLERSQIASRVSADIGGKSGNRKVDASRVRVQRVQNIHEVGGKRPYGAFFPEGMMRMNKFSFMSSPGRRHPASHGAGPLRACGGAA